MKTILFAATLLIASLAKGQKIDSIYFHLYTDSLKKGVHNYINVDAKLSDGRWLPLTAKEILFSCNAGTFEGNDLILPADCKEENVTVKATLKSNPANRIETTIWVKKKPDDEILPTKNDIINSTPRAKKKHP